MRGGIDCSPASGQVPAVLHLPDPVHPFAVHFPAAFLLLGCAALVLSLLWPGAGVLRLAALAMVLGALGATWAHRTGMAEAGQVRYVAESVVGAVRQHKADGDLMLWVSWIAAVAAVAALMARPLPGLSVLARLVAVVASVLLLWSMQATLHTGSELTHRHFFGPNAPKPAPGTEEVVRLRID